MMAARIREPGWLFTVRLDQGDVQAERPIVAWLQEQNIYYNLYYHGDGVEALIALDEEAQATHFRLRWC